MIEDWLEGQRRKPTIETLADSGHGVIKKSYSRIASVQWPNIMELHVTTETVFN